MTFGIYIGMSLLVAYAAAVLVLAFFDSCGWPFVKKPVVGDPSIALLPDTNTQDAIDRLKRVLDRLEAGEMKVRYGAVVLRTDNDVTLIEFGYANASERIGLLHYGIMQSYEDR